MAKIYAKGGTEKVIICAVREAHIRQFQATDWTDLRVGFFLSICGASDPADDDVTTGLTETIASSGGVPWEDRIIIGLTNRAHGSTFVGYSNLPSRGRIISLGDSQLVSSDVGITTANTFYWRPKHGSPPPDGDKDAVHIIDGGRSLATAPDGSQMHFIQSDPGAGQYCTLFGLRLTRDNATSRSKIITMEVKKTSGGHSSDILFTDTPTNALAQSELESFPTTVNTLGPIELAYELDTFFLYWPFHQSRLRIHEIAIVKVA